MMQVLCFVAVADLRRFSVVRREALEQWTCKLNTWKFSRMKSCSDKGKHGVKSSVDF